MRVDSATRGEAPVGACFGVTSQTRAPTEDEAGRVSDQDAGLVVVSSEQSLRDMSAFLLSGQRYRPLVALTESNSLDEPVLAYELVRAVVGPGPRIYLIEGEYLLDCLEDILGHELALPPGATRVWWPGATVGSDPGGHPLVLYLDCETEETLFAEFARQFDLSRPLVRREIAVIEDARALAERELAQAREENRDMKIERHRALTRAEAADARLRALTGPLGRPDELDPQ